MKIRKFIATLSLVIGYLVSFANADSLRTVALIGDPAPGSGVAVFSSLFTPVLNNAGQTAFGARVAGGGAGNSNDSGFWSEGGATGLALVTRGGNTAPDTGGAIFFNSFGTITLNNAGQTAFRGFLSGTGVSANNNAGIWVERRGVGLALAARNGDVAPSAGGAVFSSLNSARPLFNGADQTAFVGKLAGTGVNNSNDTGIWSEGGGNGLALVAREGDAAPDTGGAIFGNFSILNPARLPVFNDAGQTAFRGGLTGGGITSSNNGGIWSEGGGAGLALVARGGDVAPDTGGASFSIFADPVINESGRTAFVASLTGTDVSTSNSIGIWSEKSGTGTTLIARSGEVASGTGGADFSSFGSLVLNSAGQTAFRGSITGTGVVLKSNDVGIWSEGGGNGLELVARQGDSAPGTGGANFASVSAPAFNDAGQVAFLGMYTGPGVNSNRGIWAQNRSGVLKLIARTGDLLDVDDGQGIDLRMIGDVFFLGDNGNVDGRASGFNDRGEVAFQVNFTNGTKGIFVSNIATIPEPSALLLGALAVVGMLVRRRR